jgi:hypothetical protein
MYYRISTHGRISILGSEQYFGYTKQARANAQLRILGGTKVSQVCQEEKRYRTTIISCKQI